VHAEMLCGLLNAVRNEKSVSAAGWLSLAWLAQIPRQSEAAMHHILSCSAISATMALS